MVSSSLHSVSAPSVANYRVADPGREEGGRGERLGVNQPVSYFGEAFRRGCDSGMVLISRALFSPGEFLKSENSSYLQLKKLSGSWHLPEFIKRVKALAINCLVDTLYRSVERGEFRAKQLVQRFLTTQEGTLRVYLSATAMRIFAAYGASLKGEGDFTTRFFEKLISRGVKAVDSVERGRLSDAVKVGDVALRALKLRELFKKPAEALLSELLPRGREELILSGDWIFNRWIVPLIWRGLREEIVPDLLGKLSLLFIHPSLHTEREEALIRGERGALFLKLLNYATEVISDKIPLLIEKEIEFLTDSLCGTAPLPDPVGEIYSHWLKSRLKVLAKSGNPEMKRLWQVVGEHIRSTLLQCSFSLLSGGKRTSREGETVLSRLFKTLHDIAAKALSEGGPRNPEMRSKAVVDLFLEAAGLSESGGKLVEGFKEQIALPLVAEMIGDIENPLLKKGEWVKLLKRMFYRPEEVGSAIREEASQGMKDFFRELLNLEGEMEAVAERLFSATKTKKSVDDVECFVRGVSKELVAGLKEEMGSSSDSIVAAIEANGGAEGKRELFTLSLEEKVELRQFITSIAGSKGEPFEKFFEMLYRQLDSFLFKSAVLQIARAKEHEKGGGLSTVPLNIALNFLDRLDNALKGVGYCREEGRGERRGAYSDGGKKLAEALIGAVTEDLEGDIPLPRALRKPIAQRLYSELLPGYLAIAFRESCRWMDQNEELEKRLNRIYKSTYPTELFRVVELLLKEFIPYTLVRYGEEIVETSLEILQKHLGSSESLEAKAAAKVLREYASPLTELLKANIEMVGSIECNPDIEERRRRAVIDFFGNIALYLKTMLMEVGCRLGERLKKLEEPICEGDSFFLIEEVALPIADAIANHLSRINRIKEKSGVEAAALSRESLIKGFRENLHKATVKNGKSSSKERKKLRIDAFYRPLAEKILKHLELDDPNLFPFPPPFKESLYRLLSSEFLPLIILTLVEKLSQPRSLNKILIHLLEFIEEPRGKEPVERKELPKKLEKKFMKSCTYLVEEVVDLLPDAALQALFASKKIKKITSSEIGELLIKKLTSSSMRELVNNAIYFFLPMVHDGEFEGVRGKEQFVPKKIYIGQNGEVVKERSSFSIQFPKTKEGVKIYKARKLKDAEEVNEKTVEKIAQVVDKKFPIAIYTVISSKWRRLQEELDRAIKEKFGEAGSKVKETLDKICSFLIFVLLFKTLYILFYPFIAAGRFILRRHVACQSKEMVKLYQMDIHQNGFFEIVDRLV